ncbi:hypothetical protein C8J56DRAFT_892152 [Mycena floridula]|nr:hypothetical protein C8J56DRAFT_892152 [Mycena floridula]
MHFNLLFSLALVAVVVALPVPSNPEPVLYSRQGKSRPSRQSSEPLLSGQDISDITSAKSQCLRSTMISFKRCMTDRGFEIASQNGVGWRRPVSRGPLIGRAEDSLELEARDEVEIEVL